MIYIMRSKNTYQVCVAFHVRGDAIEIIHSYDETALNVLKCTGKSLISSLITSNHIELDEYYIYSYQNIT